MSEKDNKAGLRRIYRKSWPYDNIYGTSRFDLTATNRGIWNDLLDLAKLSRIEPGLIAPGPGQAYPHQWLAGLLNISLGDLEETIELLKKTDRITENHDGIKITNWDKYQTEYDRQKPYRQAKKDDDPDKYTGGRYGHMVNRNLKKKGEKK